MDLDASLTAAADVKKDERRWSPQAAAFHAAMPTLLAHEGLWEGTYTHIDVNRNVLDTHKTRVRCEFPQYGPIVYRQHNHFIWEDGREAKAELPGEFRDGRLWWDLPTFSGSAWETHDGLILLSLNRKDEPGARFFEIIMMGEGGKSRSRTWHWFKDGALYKRTLCEETRVDEERRAPHE
jgi:hypothetical protein